MNPPSRLRGAFSTARGFARSGLHLLWRALRPTYVFALQAARLVHVPNYEEALRAWDERLKGADDPQGERVRFLALQEQLERIRGLEAKAVGGLQASALVAAVSALLLWGIADNCSRLGWRVAYLVPGIGFLTISAIAFAQVLIPSPRHYPFPDFGLDSNTVEVEIATAWDMNVPIEIRVGNLITAGIVDLGRAAIFLLAGVGLLALTC